MKSVRDPIYTDDEKKFNENYILSDLRRINVAITRAQSKLIMIGDPNTLQQFKPIKDLLNIAERNDCFVELDLF